MGDVTWGCYPTSWGGGGQVAAGLEHVGPNGTDRNLDVKFTNLQTMSAGTWSVWGNRPDIVHQQYTLTHVSSTAFNSYLGTLD